MGCGRAMAFCKVILKRFEFLGFTFKVILKILTFELSAAFRPNYGMNKNQYPTSMGNFWQTETFLIREKIIDLGFLMQLSATGNFEVILCYIIFGC